MRQSLVMLCSLRHHPHHQFGSVAVMVWYFLGRPHSCPCASLKSLNAIRYQDENLTLISEIHTLVLGPGFILMQDNDKLHMTGICQLVLYDEGNDTMDWPGVTSPESYRVYLEHHHHRCHVAPQTVQELSNAPVQVSEEISQEKPRHCQEVIHAWGDHIHCWASFWLVLRNFHFN